MNMLAKLDQLNLEPAAKTEVAALIQSLVEQAERDAKLIHAKDVKIEALTFELAYYKRTLRGPESKALASEGRVVPGSLSAGRFFDKKNCKASRNGVESCES